MVSKTAFKHLGEIKEKEKNKEKHKIYKNETKILYNEIQFIICYLQPIIPGIEVPK